jgi:hypothetical protein
MAINANVHDLAALLRAVIAQQKAALTDSIGMPTRATFAEYNTAYNSIGNGNSEFPQILSLNAKYDAANQCFYDVEVIFCEDPAMTVWGAEKGERDIVTELFDLNPITILTVARMMIEDGSVQGLGNRCQFCMGLRGSGFSGKAPDADIDPFRPSEEAAG